jgi:hypothetical protein
MIAKIAEIEEQNLDRAHGFGMVTRFSEGVWQGIVEGVWQG